MGWFDSEKTKIRKHHIMNLIILAMSDKRLDESELLLLLDIASRWGLTPSELEDVLKNPHKVKYNPPTTIEDSVHQLIDLILMMMVDGKIQEREMDLCKALALSLGFLPSVVDDVIEFIIDGINKDVERDMLIKKVSGMN